MKEINLTRGMKAIVDDSDFEKVTALGKWSLHSGGNGKLYAKKMYHEKFIFMHRLIMDTPNDLEIDHINGDGLDNRKQNLRICHHRENLRNRGAQKDNKTGLKGVYKYKSGRYFSTIKVNGETEYLGLFDDPISAHRAWCVRSKELNRDFHHD